MTHNRCKNFRIFLPLRFYVKSDRKNSLGILSVNFTQKSLRIEFTRTKSNLKITKHYFSSLEIRKSIRTLRSVQIQNGDLRPRKIVTFMKPYLRLFFNLRKNDTLPKFFFISIFVENLISRWEVNFNL